MDFLKVFMFKWAFWTPWVLYAIASLFGLGCFWEKGRKERFTICIVVFFLGTFIMAILVWPDSYESMAELIKATYYFPTQTVIE